MKCPDCGAWTMVKETRKGPAESKRRRYECANGHRFSTKEVRVSPVQKPEKDAHAA